MNENILWHKEIAAKLLWIFQRGWAYLRWYLSIRKHIFHSVGARSYISPSAQIRFPQHMVLGSDIRVEDHCVIQCLNNAKIKIGDRTLIKSFAHVRAHTGYIRIGSDCTLQNFSMITGHIAGINIGNGVRIGAHSLIIGSNHTMNSKQIPIWQQEIVSKGIQIMDDVWIGSNATILDGISVHQGAVVAAGAVVTKDVPPFSIVAGVPARVIRER